MGCMQYFIKKTLDITKDHTKGIEDIFTTWQILNSWCKTLIFLIPKIENPITTNHFCLLGLCTTHYKILAKILINRLRPHFQKLISPLQGAFIKGRYTAGLFLLAQETLHSMNKSKNKKGWIILKLDIIKVFDTISWTFILNLLKAYNLPQKWISLIDFYLSKMEYTPNLKWYKTWLLQTHKRHQARRPSLPLPLHPSYGIHFHTNYPSYKHWDLEALQTQKSRL